MQSWLSWALFYSLVEIWVTYQLITSPLSSFNSLVWSSKSFTNFCVLSLFSLASYSNRSSKLLHISRRIWPKQTPIPYWNGKIMKTSKPSFKMALGTAALESDSKRKGVYLMDEIIKPKVSSVFYPCSSFLSKISLVLDAQSQSIKVSSWEFYFSQMALM